MMPHSGGYQEEVALQFVKSHILFSPNAIKFLIL
jgi:hypothetical protein